MTLTLTLTLTNFELRFMNYEELTTDRSATKETLLFFELKKTLKTEKTF